MKINDIIPYVRILINDKDVVADNLRYSDDDLRLFANDAMRRMGKIRPDIFTTYIELETEPGTVLQKLPSTVDKLVEVHYEIGGKNIKESKKETMDQATPSWANNPDGPAQFWIRDDRSTRFYYIYPKSPQNQRLVAAVVQVPQPTTVDEEFEFNSIYTSILIDGIVYLTQSIDDEHISTGRASSFYNSFVNGLQQDWQSKQNIMDAESDIK